MSNTLIDLPIARRLKKKKAPRRNVNADINRHFTVRTREPSTKADLVQMLQDAAANTALMQRSKK